ncbi:MAG: transcription-repair coupling factor [Candidatus Omnitrophica bacterium]|nr:transcription-repair coupling factor [Candidatus Omnitrophota bacterium]
MERLLSRMTDFGYTRCERVAEEGDFSRRGGVIDIYPFSFELPLRIELENDAVGSMRTFNPDTGEPLWSHSMAIILPMRKPHTGTRTTHFTEEFPLSNFVDLTPGDYVVHNNYGIGRFLGMQRLKTGGSGKDHLAIEYDRHEKLYVPVDQMHLVQKYIAFQVRKPKLYRLGSKEWQRTKARARRGIQKLAWDLLSLQAMRLTTKGFSCSPDTPWMKEFEATFAYTQTPDQDKAVAQTYADMESGQPMDRLLCGDVGYGKTEVAMRAAFKAVMNNKQVAYLVPTTILAEQHYQNFSARLERFPVNLQMLSRFKTGAEQRKILVDVAGGKVDVVIGTHRLLSDDVAFSDLGLVIIDEEQRFGVKHKEKLKALRLATDVLTLTATPIPRTLYMSLMGAKDLSVINTPPQNRLPVKTVVVEYDIDLVSQAVTRETARGGQVFYLHNRIEDIERVKERLRKALPGGIRLAVAHGRMHPKELEKIMAVFMKGDIDCLICTMIIESGIDIPNANTIIVDNAHRFGLSDLHQLRGRVGRFDRAAYAYFLIPRDETLDHDARRRLNAIQEYAQLGAGFNIAMEDLEIRGAGNLLGDQQHGFIAAVGFDLYCRLLREAVDTLREVVSIKNND